MRGKLVGLGFAVIALAWVYTTFLQGAELRGILPAWAGGPGPIPSVEEAARDYANAFDYRGSSGDDYRARLGRVTTPEWGDSPAGAQAEESAVWLDRNGGTWDHEVDLANFGLTRQNENEAVADVRYNVESVVKGTNLSSSGVVENEVRFVREGDRWVATWASENRVIERRDQGSADREETDQGTFGTTSAGTEGGATTTMLPEAPPGPSAGEQQRDEAGLVEEAVGDFSDAYDFEGSTADAYRAQIEPYVTDDYWSSPRGAQNLADMREIEAAGETFLQEAELLSWEPTFVGPEEARGYATRSFTSSVGGESGSYELRHELRLVKEDGAWKVSWGGEPM